MEARVEALGQAVAAADPAVERLAAGVEEIRAAQAVAAAGLGERVEALRERVGLLEAPAESPFAAVSEQLTRLYAQRDAGVEAMLGRLAEVEAQAAAGCRGGSGRGSARWRRRGARSRRSPSSWPRLYAQRDAAIEALLERLAPVEAQLEALGQAVAAGDPAVERLAAGIAEARAGQAAAAVRLGERLSALERAAGDARAEGRPPRTPPAPRRRRSPSS